MLTRFSLSALLSDTRYSLRAVRKDMRLFVFGTLILGLGIGACTAVFSILSPLMLRHLPFEDPERLVWVANSREEGMSAQTSRVANLRDFREQNQTFEALTGYNAFIGEALFNLVGDGEPEKLLGVGVAQNFLEVLGVSPRYGRNFVEEESIEEGRPAVILDHRFWARRYSSDPAIVGKSITLNNEPREVVGVLPASFDFASVFAPETRIDFLYPFPISDEKDRWGNTLAMVGRLLPGATAAAGQADLDRIMDGLREAEPKRWGLSAVVSPLQSQISGPFRSAMLLLAAAAASVMLIVCVNLSNLLLAKSTKRSEEMAVRSALGASRARLIRQLVIESLILSVSGSAVGLLLAWAGTRFVAAQVALDIPLLSSITVDAHAVLFSSALAIVVGAVVGLVPAVQITQTEATVCRASGRGTSGSRSSTRLRETLVIAEVALACILLVIGGLLLESLQEVLEVDLGFQAEALVAWQINPGRDYEDLESRTAYFDQLVTTVEAIPGVEVAGLTDALPLGRNRSWNVGAPGVDYNGQSGLDVFPHVVDRRYISAMQIPLLRGRQFSAADTLEAPGVVILNESAAEAVFFGEEALGRTVVYGGSQEAEVVGVVADIRHLALEKSSGPQMYLPFTQTGDFGALDLVVRSSLNAPSLAQSVTASVRDFDPTLPTREYQTLNAIVERSVSPRRFTVQVLGIYSATALLLAALGIYSVLSYSVTERVREIGIRMALGETPTAIVSKVIRRTLLLAGVGLTLGLLGSFLVTKTAATMFYGAQPTSSIIFLAMPAILLAVAAVAGLIPALRASRTDIVSVLSAE